MNISPPILLAALSMISILAGMYFYGLSKRWGLLIPLAGMFLFSTMSIPTDSNDQVVQTVWLPLQSRRSLFFLASGGAGLLMLLFHFHRGTGKRLPISAFLIASAGLYAALLRFVHGGGMDGTQSVLFAATTLTPLLLIPVLYLDTPDDLLKLMRVFALVNIVWVGMCMVQLVIDKSMLTLGNEFRFIGLQANPQHTGALMACFFVISLWILLNESKKYSIFLIALVGVNGILLMWTGSRTGVGMAVIGVSAILYSRAGRAILLLPVAGIIGYISLQVLVNTFSIELLGFERLTSTENTRDVAWKTLLEHAFANPVFGVGVEDAEKSENSWLYGFASYGFGMLLILIAAALAASAEMLSSVRTRFRAEPKYRNYLDFMVGLMAMYFAGALLEGYMISRVSPMAVVFITLSVANYNIRRSLMSSGSVQDIEELWENYDGQYLDDMVTD